MIKTSEAIERDYIDAQQLGLSDREMLANIKSMANRIGDYVAEAIQRSNVADDGQLAELFDKAVNCRNAHTHVLNKALKC